MGEIDKVIHGDSLHELESLTDESVDLLCTDPPYGYSFMGKAWDKALPDIDIFKECFRVLKPGAFAFVMSAPRSDVCSRMAILLEDAGFNIAFTPIYWTYACLSEDTELYTPRGWQRLDQLRRYDFIGVYDDKQLAWKWESPSAWNTYEVAEDLYRIKSEETDQLVSQNHRVYTSEGLRFAEHLPEQVEVVCLSGVPEYFRDIPSRDTQEAGDSGYVLHRGLSAESRDGVSASDLAQNRLSKVEATTGERVVEANHWGVKSLVEGWSNVFQNARELYGSQIHSLSRLLSLDGSQGRLCYGASYSGGASTGTTITPDRGGASYRPQSAQQSYRESDAIRHEPRPQAPRTRKTYRTTLASVSRVPYRGVIFCPTVSTGVFLARRNGKIFLTGNSGFPKAMNIGKMLDKRAATDEAKALDGSYSGFQPKPAVEVVIVAMKPLSEKTFVDQALKNGKGITWLDDARIPSEPYTINTFDSGAKPFGDAVGEAFTGREHSGRFPANLLVSDDVLNDGSVSKSQKRFPKYNKKTEHTNTYTPVASDYRDDNTYGDVGGYSRFFSLDAWAQNLPFLQVPKASKREKNPEGVSNTHPTCKPLTLMSYLITLGSRHGDVVLDPFMGSGTTCIAAKQLGRNYIGIEREKEYVEIAEARLNAVPTSLL